MNRVHLLFLLCCLLSGWAAAQEVIYTPYQKFDHRKGDFEVAGRVGDRIYTYRNTNGEYYLDAWDDSMNLKATVVLDFFPDKVSKAHFVTYPDHMVALYQTTDRNRTALYSALLDAQGLLQGRPQLLEEMKTGIFGSGGHQFDYTLSEGKNFLLFYQVDQGRKDVTLRGWLLNNSGKKIRTINANYTGEGSVRPGDLVVTDQGAVYLSVLRIAGAKDYAGQGVLLQLDTNGRRYTEVPIPVPDIYLGSTFMRMAGGSGQLVLSGFYSDEKNGQYDGVYFTAYDPVAATFQPLKQMPFSDRLRVATGARNTRKAFNDYVIRNLVVRRDGGFVLVAENTYVTTRGYGNPYGFYSYYYSPFSYGATVREYYYNDIVVLSYGPDALLEWSSFVRKSQYSQEDGGRFSSFAFLNTGGSLAMLYNDFNTRRSSIQLAAIDGEGKQQVRSMAAGSNTDPDWLPRLGKQTAQRELIVPCLRRGELCFARVTF